MTTTHHSRVDSMFVACGSSNREAQVPHAWQDVTAAQRDPIMRVMSMQRLGGDRRLAPGAVAGLRARASQAMILNRPAEQELLSTQRHQHNPLGPNFGPTSNVPSKFKDSLYGRSLSMHPVASSNIARSQSRPLSGLVTNAVSGQRSTSPQRPHTAPATERKFRRSSSSSHRRPNVGKSVAGTGAAEVPFSESPGKILSARPQPSGASLRTGALTNSHQVPALGPTWQRRMRGVTAPGDFSERRAGRSHSTEPLLFRQEPSIANSWSGEAASITNVMTRSPGRPRMKAPVDCWWDERQSNKATPARSRNLFSSLGAGQGSRMRSSSAGRRKQRTSSFSGLEASCVGHLQSDSSPDSKQSLRPGSPHPPTRDRSGIRTCENSGSRHKRWSASSNGAMHALESPQADHSGKTLQPESAIQHSGRLLHRDAESCRRKRNNVRNALHASDSSLCSTTAAGCVVGTLVNKSILWREPAASCGDAHALLEVPSTPTQQVLEVSPSQVLRGRLHCSLSCESEPLDGMIKGRNGIGGPKGQNSTRMDHARPEIGCKTSSLPSIRNSLQAASCELDDFCSSGPGELRTLHFEANSLANALGITDRWCCGLFKELLDMGMVSDSEFTE
eukprot:jgi/Ulvmu1/7274/UM035_0062.1